MIEAPLRQRIDISEGWQFVRGRVGRRWMDGRKRGGEVVDLPHCWNRTDTYQFGRRSFSGRGAYRREIDIPEAADTTGRWHLRTEGFYGWGDVWLDGRTIARIDGQYLGIDVPLPESMASGGHLLTIRLDNLFQKRVLPGRRDPDFLLYGGLACRVWLEWVPSLRIDAQTVEVVCTRGPENAEILELRCSVHGRKTAPDGLALNWTITTTGGEHVASAGPAPVEGDSVSVLTTIVGPEFWSPDSPRLYWAEARLESDSSVAEIVRIRFGITRAEFRPDEGFFLDGQRIDLHGCNRHESIPGLGNALPAELHLADAQLLKQYGCNFVRLSHYPQHPAFLDACDELGILVYAEIATWKSVSSSRDWRRAARRQMHDLIVRDRHHPSVILWGMGNESRSRTAFVELADIARELDPTRPVTYAENHLYRARREKTVGIPDVWGLNYELETLEEARAACSLRNVVIAECCNYPHSVRGDEGAELTQLATLEYEWKLMAGKPYVAGHAVWCYSDYATEYRNRVRRHAGLFDAWRQPKMAAELFRARYSKEPFVSLFIVAGTKGPDVHLFSNCERVALNVDGATQSELDCSPHSIVNLDGSWTSVVAEGFAGETSVRREIQAWNEAATIVLEVEGNPTPGRTVAVDLSIRDTSGTPVRDWVGDVGVSIEGDAELLSYTGSGEVDVTRGTGRVYVQIGPTGEPFVIHATADGLKSGSISGTPRR